jgi:ABC-type transport system involved in multi-copper enzyme maturation permease subunit
MSPRASAIALTAAKSEIAQPLFLLLVSLGLLAIAVFVFLPFHTFGEDIKLLKDCGITVILVVSLFQGVWSASSSVSEEIEGRTALTVLSKPVGRRSFLIGKMLGVFWILMLMFLILGSALILAVAYKPIYEARENSLEAPLWQACHLEMIRTLPGLAMAFLQSLTLSAFSVAIATRLPQFANFAVCFSIYLVGHLTESLVGSAEGGFPILQFIGQLIAVIVPDLEHFSMQAAIDAGNPIPIAYLSGTLVYAILYLGLSLLLGLLLFEDRDLA